MREKHERKRQSESDALTENKQQKKNCSSGKRRSIDSEIVGSSLKVELKHSFVEEDNISNVTISEGRQN